MRAFLFVLLFAFPCVGAVAAPVDLPSNIPTTTSAWATSSPTMRVSLINTSGERRQVRLKDGRLVELPFAKRVDVDVRLGAAVHVVSDSNRRVDQQIVIAAGDDARLILVR